MSRAIVIGGGIGGLATACYLAKDGHDVQLFEKNEMVGGKASSFEEGGFRFDMGPSWYLMPDVFERFFQDMGKDIKDYLDLEPLDPSYRIYFGDGEYVDMSTDVEKVKKIFEKWEPGSAAKFDTFLERSKYAYEVAMEDFVYKNYNSLLDFLNWKLVVEGRKLHVFESMQRYVSRYFKDSRIQKVLQYTLVFLGGSPSNTPALYNIMSHIDFNMGVFYPQGGMIEVPKAMEKIAKELGVQIHVNSPIEAIHVDPKTKRATGVTAGGTMHSADVVVSNADYHFTETKLLEEQYRQYSRTYWKKRVQSPSALIFFLGFDRRFDELQHHTLFFAKDWEQHFADIFDRKEWPEDPSFYIGCPSRSDESVAPKGGENLFILIPIAADLEDTPEIRAIYLDFILETLSRTAGADVKPHLKVQRSFCVSDFKSRYNAHAGSALGLAHTLFQTALFRPRNYSKKVKNLFYVGANTVPGIGVPMCLISGHLVRDRVRTLLKS